MLARSFAHLVRLLLVLILITGLLSLPPSSQAQTPLPTSFTYQGQLLRSDSPITATCAFQFSLFDAPTSGNPIGSTATITPVNVIQGYFQVELDFGTAAFTGDARYLEIGVQCSDETTFTTLQGRVNLTATPYALHALTVDTNFTDDRYWRLGGNEDTILDDAILGTTDGVSLTLVVSDSIALRLEPTSDIPNLLGGGEQNRTARGVIAATIGGGGPHRIFDNYGTIGGGRGNTIGTQDTNVSNALYATIGGGLENSASNTAAVVSGGSSNSASGELATISGGSRNTAGGETATVGGGTRNNATGDVATVGGGRDNTASGTTATISGGDDNTALGLAATIGGGRGNAAAGEIATIAGGLSNSATGEAATVGGGRNNLVQADYATISGGGPSDLESPTTTSNQVFDNYGTIGGGGHNIAGSDDANRTNALFATVSGGSTNTADGETSAIGGGLSNTASGESSTISGGRNNLAQADYATIGGGGPTDPDEPTTTSNFVFDNYGTVGGGGGNIVGSDDGNRTNAFFATVGGGSSNTASGETTTIAGGLSNTASGESATVGGGRNNLAQADYATISGGGPSDPDAPTTTSNEVFDNYGAIGGGGGNTVGSDDGNRTNATYATIGGGGRNTASGNFATIGGGEQNIVTGGRGTVAGGSQNDAGASATVGGGTNNSASANAATVGGGLQNDATAQNATVSGGFQNIASANAATIPGGSSNTASADFTFAAGRNAKADDLGAFVWADSTNVDIRAPGANTFSVRASGGIWLGTTSTPVITPSQFIATSTGAFLSTGGVWTNASDRNVKANFATIDPRAILSRVVALPITTWNYRAESHTIRHIGPMAQDFAAAFSLGAGDTTISTVDADGVALAAIQGLHSLVQEKDAQITALAATNAVQQQQITALQEQNAALEARLTALEQRLGVSPPPSESGYLLGGLVLLLATLLLAPVRRFWRKG